MVFAKNFARFYEKKMILGTSDAWSKRLLSHRPSDPAYYIEDCQIFENLKGIWVRSGVQPINSIDNTMNLMTATFVAPVLLSAFSFAIRLNTWCHYIYPYLIV